jgi:hypothetical protein
VVEGIGVQSLDLFALERAAPFVCDRHRWKLTAR